MNVMTVKAKQPMLAVSARQALWLEFYRALSKRNFVRAVHLAHQLNVDEERIRLLQRDALKQFIVEYQNFEGAFRLCADFGISCADFARLIGEIMLCKELEERETFALHAGVWAHVSKAEQIRNFARRQLKWLQAAERQKAFAERWRKLIATVKSWLDRLSDPWQGGFPHGGLAYR